MFANYNLICNRFFLFWLIYESKITHFALFCGGLMSVYFITTHPNEWFPMVGVGIAWASILSIPYAMLSGSLPSDKMGYYMESFLLL
jgi:maltose/moltooligosaccharide transporter